ncbi:sigma-70 family RNA polymerase sigma factor [Gracilibacillus oryzae]|uniref:Sigma-70 family RNA polymerase sigma factor n=1 Tax=Gracilibacillus oryzae TaxID=1672701 RepID=A0A7C8L1W9_9BACI|nr:sigma-70 family RNA polymerase sigma factor [Gracilibacillus oryzae]KAB8139281.1 sigma-70 family RNA polymerase sigma factor [Gracilibacillus oryzae]
MDNWADALIIQYEEGRRELRDMAERLCYTEDDIWDRKQYNSMIRSMSEAIEWLKTGREPGDMHGADKQNIYQHTLVKDMDIFQSLDIFPEEKKLSEEQKRFLVREISRLSTRERQCFLLAKGYQWTHEEIAEELNISINTVKSSIRRAKEKFRRDEYVA